MAANAADPRTDHAATEGRAPRFDPTAAFAVTADDVVFARPDGIELLARIYRPVGDGAPTLGRPALIDVHGGAWRYFDRQADAYFDRALAACGAVVIALDFRQAPDHRWPSAAVDVHSGIRWAKAHAAELGIRTDDLGLIGGSSGGHLVLVTALRSADATLAAGEFVTKPIDPADVADRRGLPALGSDATVLDPAAVDASCRYALPLWPIAAPDLRYRYLLERLAEPDRTSTEPMFDPERLKRCHERFFGDEATMFEASAQRVIEDRSFDQLPPVWIVQPALDENVTVEMNQALATAYRDAGGDATLVIEPGVGHSFVNFGGDAADRCIEGMKAFIAQHLD